MIQQRRPNTIAENLSWGPSTHVSSQLFVTPSSKDPASLGIVLKHTYTYSIQVLLRNRTYRMNIHIFDG